MSTEASNADDPQPGEGRGGTGLGPEDEDILKAALPQSDPDGNAVVATAAAPASGTQCTPEQLRVGIWAPQGGQRIEGGPLVRLVTTLAWGTLVLIAWVGVFLAAGAGLFLWVAVRQDAATAYDVITQHISPTDTQRPKFGLAEYLPGIFGYFVAPAIIGAVVAGVFVANSTMSEDRAAKGLAWATKLTAKARGRHRKKSDKLTPHDDSGRS